MDTNTKQLAVGTKVFKRSEKLRQLLESVPNNIEKVYVADDGNTTEREDVYAQNYHFDLSVLDLEYDAGLAVGRNKIVEESSEDYLMIVDSDHRIPNNWRILLQQLVESPEVGGISGLLLENNSIIGSCHNIYIFDDILVRDADTTEVSFPSGYPLFKFDFIPNAALFKRECLEDRGWDEGFRIGKEHIDFYTNYKKHTDWEFGVCPSVIFTHEPGGNENYTATREDLENWWKMKKQFLNKYSLKNQIVIETDYFNQGKSITNQLKRKYPHILGKRIQNLNHKKIRLIRIAR